MIEPPSPAPQPGAGPRATVLVMTYNHEKLIRTALDSALIQETNFPFEILISEDCSTDATRAIVQEYAEKYRGRIRLILSERNVRSNEIVARGIRGAAAPYIALLDGDDYWTSPRKLQKQVEFLDAHPECTICFHQMTVHHDDASRPDWFWTPSDQKPISTLADLWMGNFIATGSTMFRRDAIGSPPAWYDSFFPITDWPLHLLNAEKGTIGYIDEPMGVYRYHAGGLYSALDQDRKLDETLRLYNRLNEAFGFRYNVLAKAGIFHYFADWALEYAAVGDRARARTCIRRSLLGRPLRGREWAKIAKAYIRTSFRSRTEPAHGTQSS